MIGLLPFNDIDYYYAWFYGYTHFKENEQIFIHSIDVSDKDKATLLRNIKHYEDLILEVMQ